METQVVINGQKTFISNGINCDLLILAARDTREGRPLSRPLTSIWWRPDRPGFEKGKKIPKIGWHSQDTAELYFTDCRIPKTNRLGLKGSGFLMLMEEAASRNDWSAPSGPLPQPSISWK